MTQDVDQLRLQLDSLREEIRQRRGAEEQLRQSEERFRHLVENAHDVVYRVRLSPRLKLEYVSPIVGELLGISVGELVDDPAQILQTIHPDDSALLTQYLEAGDFVHPLTVRCQHADGHLIWLQHRALPVYDEEGDLLVVEGIVRDVSQLRHLLEGMDDADLSVPERDRLISAYQRIGSAALSTLELDDVLDTLAEQVVRAGIFRSLMIALVDHQHSTIRVERNYVSFSSFSDGIGEIHPGAALVPFPAVVHREGERHVFSDHRIIGTTYDLEDDNITPTVARTGELTVIDGWDDRFDEAAGGPQQRHQSVAVFIPIMREGRVLAVMATGEQQSEKQSLLRRIEVMSPLLEQVAIALDHALLFGRVRDHVTELADLNGRLRSEVSRRLQAEQTLRDFSVRTIELQEQERRRVARELHDGVNQLLCAVGFGLDCAVREVTGESDPRVQLESTRQLLDQTIREVQRISHSLRPGVLDDLGLIPAIRSLCEEFREGTRRELDHHLADVGHDMPQELAVTIYRLLQETLYTLQLRGGPSHTRVELMVDDGYVLEVRAEGLGTELGSTIVDNMRARADLVGGRLELEAHVNGVGCLRLRLPLETMGVLTP